MLVKGLQALHREECEQTVITIPLPRTLTKEEEMWFADPMTQQMLGSYLLGLTGFQSPPSGELTLPVEEESEGFDQASDYHQNLLTGMLSFDDE
ncbi:hypothetical protein ACFYKX_10175 [Cytobacillus sp. FJAT-54145]|uniref:Uncharacterized protein n=1 Tax=Cytobacillus spartinae TaxID=3299023 RepID=A0ABW6KDK4_9BACI